MVDNHNALTDCIYERKAMSMLPTTISNISDDEGKGSAHLKLALPPDDGWFDNGDPKREVYDENVPETVCIVANTPDLTEAEKRRETRKAEARIKTRERRAKNKAMKRKKPLAADYSGEPLMKLAHNLNNPCEGDFSTSRQAASSTHNMNQAVNQTVNQTTYQTVNSAALEYCELTPVCPQYLYAQPGLQETTEYVGQGPMDPTWVAAPPQRGDPYQF